MSREHRLQNVLNSPNVWVATQSSVAKQAPVPTGFAALDQKLGGGWPVGSLIEILLNGQGIGELRCLLPALARLTQGMQEPPERKYSDFAGAQSRSAFAEKPVPAKQTDWVTWIAPPHIPYAPALAQHGLNVAKLLVVRTRKSVDALWAMEQALHSTASNAVLAWCQDIDTRSIRRIQLAAEAGSSLAVIFRPARYLQHRSPAALRIQLKFVVNGPVLHIVKNRYGELGTVCLPDS